MNPTWPDCPLLSKISAGRSPARCPLCRGTGLVSRKPGNQTAIHTGEISTKEEEKNGHLCLRVTSHGLCGAPVTSGLGWAAQRPLSLACPPLCFQRTVSSSGIDFRGTQNSEGTSPESHGEFVHWFLPETFSSRWAGSHRTRFPGWGTPPQRRDIPGAHRPSALLRVTGLGLGKE